MKKIVKNILLITVFFLLLSNSSKAGIIVEEEAYSEPNIPVEAKAIIESYPDFNIKYQDNLLIFEDGSFVVFDDKKEKSFVDILDECDVNDMFLLSYNDILPPKMFADGGRGRSDELFSIMYGKNKNEVISNLVAVDWFGQRIDFTKVNSAYKKLEDVRDDILLNHPELVVFCKKAGTFNYRKISGTKRLSPHGYGIAIDINTKYSDYWLYGNPSAKETDEITYVNKIPIELVKIFEKHGFIWGGYWYHYDTMHFEYRPEIIKYFRDYNTITH